MNIKHKVYKIFKPIIESKKELDKYDINDNYYEQSNVDCDEYNSYHYTSSSGTCTWETPFGEPVITPILDVERDCNTKIYINKENRKYEMTKKQLYRLIFMLEEEGETVYSCPLYLFENFLTAVKI